jgi:hypothetical protein
LDKTSISIKTKIEDVLEILVFNIRSGKKREGFIAVVRKVSRNS